METLPATAVLGLAVLAAATARGRGFEEDVAFLRRHVDLLVLEDGRSGARVAVVPAWQGRVMTSATGGAEARGYGWINEELVASRQLRPHINAFGGEDRLWLGPEGGQFSIFFRKGDPFDLEHWQTPPLFDTEPWAVVEKDGRHAAFRHRGTLVNYSGTALDVQIDRTVRVLDRGEAVAALGGPLPEAVRLVAFTSENTLTNAGKAAWTRQEGLLSLWILGMFRPSPATTIVVPYREGTEAERGPVVNDAYFGKVPADRLVTGKDVLFFSGDGRHRSKIGLSPRRAQSRLGSYDAEGGVLTIVTFDRPEGAASYVNSMWEIQKEPFAGDVVNSYNDGPPSPGAKPMGPFYELETSSPAAALAPGARLTHVHRTFHLQGGTADLDALARRLLGTGLDRIRTALPSGAR
ncbi:MAG TPA: DUF6786 family protein [Vicinamibacteria bacterium]|nr:DUF6786 family protein [Vicinamibacteria bacterium]